MQVAVLASGSSGNALWISSGETSLLVDAGLPASRVRERALELDLDLGTLEAVLVTHEHSDHVAGLGPVARRFDLPVFATPGTFDALNGRLGRCRERVLIEAGRDFGVGELTVSPFSLSHDCAEPVGFTVTDGASRVAVATDLGVVGRAVRNHLSQADCVVLEFNHDERMLLDGEYPWPLKRRILSRAGHLSNETAARELTSLTDSPVSTVILAHLSRENNRPELALRAATGALERAGRGDVRLLVADQERVLGPVEVVGRVRGPEDAPEGALASCTG